MSDKKNIDRLFQEKFKDFEVEPNEKIWINIDSALREKKKRRIIPVWFKLTGIAAGLILGFFIWNSAFNDSTLVEGQQEGQQIVGGNKTEPKENNPITSSENESVTSSENPNTKNNKDNITPPSINQKTNDINDSANESSNAVVNHNKQEKGKANSIDSETTSGKDNAIVGRSTQTEKTSVKKKANQNSYLPESKNHQDAFANNGTKPAKNKKTSTKESPKSKHTFSKHEEEHTAVAENKNNPNKNAIEFGSENKIADKEKPDSSFAENQKQVNAKNDIIKDDFKKVETADLIKDSTTLAVAQPNALEELLKKNEEEKNTIADAKINRWQITSSIAPIYFSSTSNGSPIDAQFAENSKSYENNLSFGVGVNYAVSKKISVRTGINKFTLGYSTNDVVFFAAMDRMSLGSVASSAAGSTIQVVSVNNTEALRPFDNEIQSTTAGVMTQRMGYFEVPVEMSYKLIDNKFGVNLIGGLSTLFLNENEVSVKSSMMSASLGKATNLNDIHFSTNIGVGFRYRFWKSFEANFEPMFKYQINTFNKDAGNFKPYFIGLYSGVSFNF